MTQSAIDLLDRAIFCRRLANAIAGRAIPIAGALRELADQYQEQALPGYKNNLPDREDGDKTVNNL